jgi:probable rRNA maturation factor
MTADVVIGGRPRPLPDATVRRIVGEVLRRERRVAAISITFVGRVRMRALNLEFKGHDRPTDVLSFPLDQPDGSVLGDVYICPWVAAQEAKRRRIRAREEVTRLIVHGTLHALGWDHPEDTGRERSAMWRRQERYVEALA